jgi:hypothetical protein
MLEKRNLRNKEQNLLENRPKQRIISLTERRNKFRETLINQECSSTKQEKVETFFRTAFYFIFKRK